MTLRMDITKWLIPKSKWLHSWEPKIGKLYTVSKNKSCRADCGSDYQLLTGKFRLQLKKVGKIVGHSDMT